MGGAGGRQASRPGEAAAMRWNTDGAARPVALPAPTPPHPLLSLPAPDPLTSHRGPPACSPFPRLSLYQVPRPLTQSTFLLVSGWKTPVL